MESTYQDHESVIQPKQLQLATKYHVNTQIILFAVACAEES
jgi:hypothetical protein